jgi:hypothetical protein
MTANGKVSITITSSYLDENDVQFGNECMQQNRVVIAEAILRTVEHSDVSLLELSVAVPSEDLDHLMVAMLMGETKIAINRISPAVDLD